MNYFHQAPFVRLLAAFLMGIICAVVTTGKQLTLFYWIGGIMGGVFLLSFFIHPVALRFHSRMIHGIVIHLLLLSAGYVYTSLRDEIRSETHFSRFIQQKNILTGVIDEPLREKENTYQAIIRCKAIRQNNQLASCSGKILVYLQKDSSVQQLQYGDEVLLEANLTELSSSKNPAEFDYRQLMHYRGVSHQCYLKTGKWKKLPLTDGNMFITLALKLRNYFLTILTRHGLTGNDFAVGSALIVGYEDALNTDIINSYAHTGALHVLSVSGMHVGIIYMVFHWLLLFLEKSRRGKLIKAFLLLTLIWFYAALTGLSPSVLRSAAMFSFIIVGQSLQRSVSVYNTLAVSAFTLLLVNPYLIMDVGFQLSYVAVLGIVIIHPGIYALFSSRYFIIDKTWQLTSVAIAAQISTFPLGFYYFHQFPNYFLITNLAVILFSSIIIYSGLLLLMVSFLPAVASGVSYVLTGSLKLLNGTVEWIDQLPGALWEGVVINTGQILLLYGMIVFLIVFFFYKHLRWFRYALVTAIVFCVSVAVDRTIHQQQQGLIIYHIPKHTAIDFINGTQNILLTDSSFGSSSSLFKFHIQPYHWKQYLHHPIPLNVDTIGTFHNHLIHIYHHFICFGNKRLLIIDHLNCKQLQQSTVSLPQVDYILLRNNCDMPLTWLKTHAHFRKIIYDTSNSLQKIKQWESEASGQGIATYPVTFNGAFVEEG